MSKVSSATTDTCEPSKKVKISRMRHFLVHFRRRIGASYDGSYGFDWLRDEYVYDIEPVLEVGGRPTKLYRGNKLDELIQEYIRLRRSDGEDLQEVTEIKPLNCETYIPAWLSIFPISTPINADGVDLHLQIDQEQNPYNDAPPDELTNDGTVLTFETSAGISVTPTQIPLGKLIQSRQQRELNSSVEQFTSKTVYYSKDESVTINIKATSPIDQAGYVKLIAKKGNETRNVGVLMLYPNTNVKTTDIEIVEFNHEYDPQDTGNTHKAIVPVQQYGKYTIDDVLKTKSYNQAIITPTVSNQNIVLKIRAELQKYNQQIVRLAHNPASAEYQQAQLKKQEIEAFLSKYSKANYPANGFISIDMVIPKALKNELRDDIIRLFECLHFGKVGEDKTYTNGETITKNYQSRLDTNENRKTYAIFTTYVVADGRSEIRGLTTDFMRATEEEVTLCQAQGNIECHSVAANVIVYFRSGVNEETLVHELGHSFNLPHTFNRGGPKSNTYSFYQGYTDNVMDYNLQIPSPENPRDVTHNPFAQNKKAFFKWQWDIIRSDRSVF